MLRSFRNSNRTLLAGFAAFTLTMCISVLQVNAQSYNLKKLGTLGGVGCPSCESRAFGINNQGRVVGTSHKVIQPHPQARAYTAIRAFRTASNSAINPATDDLGEINGYPWWPGKTGKYVAYAINDSGQVVGGAYPMPITNSFLALNYVDPQNYPLRGFFYENNGPMVDLETFNLDFGFGDTTAFSINQSSNIVGERVDGGRFAFLLQGNQLSALTSTLSSDAGAYDINKYGNAVGYYFLGDQPWINHAFVYRNNQVTDIGTLDPACADCLSTANAINNKNRIVGSSNVGPNFPSDSHAFLSRLNPLLDIWEMEDLGTLGGDNSAAYDINLKGQIVGRSQKMGNAWRAFVYTNNTMKDLNQLAQCNNCTLEDARGINAFGQIVGTARSTLTNLQFGYLLTPKPVFIAQNVTDLIPEFDMDRSFKEELVKRMQTIANGIGRDNKPGNLPSIIRQIDEFRAIIRIHTGQALDEADAKVLIAGADLLQSELEESGFDPQPDPPGRTF